MRKTPGRKTRKKQPQFSLVSRIVIALILTIIIGASLMLTPKPEVKQPETVLAKRTISLEKRYGNSFVNDVFKDNILLNLAYMEGKVKKSTTPDWNTVKKPFTTTVELKPNETFAFHKDVLPQYEGKVAKTTNASFNAQEGFKFSGLYFGDGVCHLASVMYWVAKDAGLDAVAPTNHDFATIPQVPREYGVAIYNDPGNTAANARQNLYVTNNKNEPVILKFSFDGENLAVAVVKHI